MDEATRFRCDLQHLLQESAEKLEQMRETDRARARLRLKTAPMSLSDYERKLLGVEVQSPRRKSSTPSARNLVVKAVCPAGITFRTPLLQRFNDHAINLAVLHRIAVKRRSANSGGCAHQEARTIEAPAVTNEETYAVFLHELGHILSPEGDSRQYPFTIKEKSAGDPHGALIAPRGEIGAWNWAVKNAVVWTIAMQERMADSLGSYSYSATPHERDEMAFFVTQACLRVTGTTWTFEQLEKKRASIIRGAS